MKSADKPLSEYERSREENRKSAAAMAVAVIILVGIFTALLMGCAGTVVPRPVESAEASWDGNAQNSGILASQTDGFLVTDQFRARYNALIVAYGARFQPPLKKDHGLTPAGTGRWLISKQGMAHMLTMNQWRKAAISPHE